ncbi:MAG: Gfo/Idh/MocA family oxidoreductase [Bryobacteraceae bacterium]|nr:Gfo/Idh/MocA family oxidoreductase [Bryobacterales bacterium]NUM99943.1 Gfo/Idh/MocA family oxidoreductase [Bryobacteraceae bacterium]
MNQNQKSHRREFLNTASAAFTTSIFTGRVKGANDRIALGHIGLGAIGMSSYRITMKMPNAAVKAVCELHEPYLKQVAAETGGHVRTTRDFREILADKSIDAISISTPNHWHAYMAVEACKAGKDVYVEKPLSYSIEEGTQMVQAARKYNRVVQAGTWQRSAPHFQKACELLRGGAIGKIAFARTWNYDNRPALGFGTPPEGGPPPGFDWDMWLGPAPWRPYNRNRVGRPGGLDFPGFHWYWDYGGAQVTNWGAHWIDIVQMAFGEIMPKSVMAAGGKFHFTDDREIADTVQVSFEYPGFLACYENRNNNGESMFAKSSGMLFHGSLGTMSLDRQGYRIIPERGSPVSETSAKTLGNPVAQHWENFLECVRTRQRPNSDVEYCNRSTTACHLGIVALRSGMRIDWDEANWTVKQTEARRFLAREPRPQWKIVV